MGDVEPVQEDLVTFSFQFFTRLAAVFAEEGGDCASSRIQRCFAFRILCIHIRTFGN